jgi:hypothetical protein
MTRSWSFEVRGRQDQVVLPEMGAFVEGEEIGGGTKTVGRPRLLAI